MLKRLQNRSRSAINLMTAARWRVLQHISISRHVKSTYKNDRTPVLVYVMSKVASSTVAQALRPFHQFGVVQVHRIHPENIKKILTKMETIGLPRNQVTIDILGLSVYKNIIAAGRKAKIITLVREPIARNVSFYFQVLDHLWQTTDAYQQIELQQLLDEFYERFDHSITLTWFDNEFKRVLGIDVYAHKFPKDKGYLRIQTERYDVLVMRTDVDDEVKKRCLEEFLGVTGVSLMSENIGADKKYGETYRRFLEGIHFSDEYIDAMLNSRYAQHFFTAEERVRLHAKWSRRENGPSTTH